MSDMNESGVPFLDLRRQFAELQAEWLASIQQTGANGSFILGPNVHAFESEIADYVGVRHAVAVANGTDALMLSLRAMDIGPGDEVITTPYTFFASAEVIDMVGATPVFVDIDAGSFNLDPIRIEQALTPRTKAILPVHLFGCPVDMTAVLRIAAAHDVPVIEDCAQAFGAVHDGHKVGSLGDTGCFSFYPTKVLGCYGDGGLVTTNSDSVAERLRHLRNHGARAPFEHDEIGCNSRLDEIQAALLRIKLRSIDSAISARVSLAARYSQRLADDRITTPPLPDHGAHVFNLYTVRVADRDRVRRALTDHDIGSSLCYPVPLHLQQVYHRLDYSPGSLPICEQASQECLSLPIYPDMEQVQLERVCEVLIEALG